MTPIVVYGASVCGPYHEQAGKPNEDAWLASRSRHGTLAVVCDGLGSRPHARIGSLAACRAVREAVQRWALADNAPLNYLVNLIETLWRLRIHPHIPDAAATTCLLALARQDGSWLMGGIGDGQILFQEAQDPVAVVHGDKTGFGNITTGLGVGKGFKDWQLTIVPPCDHERLAVLCTDGVADDLDPARYSDFFRWITPLGELRPAVRRRRLIRAISNWPTPHHSDDKTLAVLHSAAACKKETP